MNKSSNVVTDPLGLIGEDFGDYHINALVGETGKDVVYEANDSHLGRDVLIKILKPGKGLDRQEQFLKEGRRLAELDEHPSIATVYSAGQKGEYSYIVMKLIRGDNISQIIESGKRLSLEEIVKILSDVGSAVSYAHSKGVQHRDIKLENIVMGEKVVCLADWGGRLSEDVMTDDLYALGIVTDKLFKHCSEKIPERLNEILINLLNKKYLTADDLKKAIDDYKKYPITRRRFIIIASIVLPIITILGTKFGVVRYLNHINSIDYIIDEIRDVDATDYEKIEPLFRELAHRICDQKIRRLAETNPKDKFPYATTDKGNWFLTQNGIWTEGFWPGILWTSYKITRDPEFKEHVMSQLRNMHFTEDDSITINPIRYYYSHALGYEITENRNFLDTALEASDLISKRFNNRGNFLEQISGKIKDSDSKKILFIDTMNSIIPLLCWAFQNKGKFRKIIIEHSYSVIKFNINENGSVIQTVEFDPITLKRISGIRVNGFNEISCLSRGQARAIKGFTDVYRVTEEDIFLQTAENLTKYFVENLPSDGVPFYDFKDPRIDIPKDSSAATITASALLDLFKITSNEKYKLEAYKILKSLSERYLSTGRDYEGMILHGCVNINNKEYIDSSLIYSDYFFLESLSKI